MRWAPAAARSRVPIWGRCMLGRKARALSPARSATGSAAPSPPSPMPTSSSGASAPTVFSAARSSSTSKAQGARSKRASPRRSASIQRRRPTASCASPPRKCPTWCVGSPPSAASMPAISPSSPMAGPAPCTPRWLRANCASPRSSSRAPPAISPPTACWSRSCAAISSRPGSRRLPRPRLPRSKTSTPRWSGAAARPCAAATWPSPASRSSARRTCVMSGRSTRSPSSFRSSCFAPRIATELKPASMPFTRPATAIRPPARRPRSSACAARSRASCAGRHSSLLRRASRHLRLMPSAAPARFISLNCTKLDHYGVENLDPGDILLTNDAYITGSHLNHMTFTVPIFHDGEVVAFSCCMAHWPDVGGTLDGATTDIFSEGLQMPIVKIYRKGVPNEELISIIRTNVRLPERAMGDFRAQIAAVKTGERRFLEMIHKYGRDAVIGGIEAIMGHSEAAARARVREIPDGVYEAESFMDDDGIKLGERVPIRVRVEIAGDRMKVDLTDVAKQVAGFYNSGETAGRSCCQVAFKCLTSALHLPINDGQFRALEIVLPPGRVVSALKPAAMRMWMTYPMTIIDTIFKALAPAIPEHIIAGHHADLVVGRVNGRRPRDDSFYIYLGGLIGGGWGAKHNSDGCNATIAMNDGDTHNGPSEQVEAKYPLLVERYALRPDSGGAGRFRGGLGCEQVVQARHDLRFNSQMDRVKCKPWGLEGGLCGSGNSVAIHRFPAEQEQRFHNGKALNQVLHAGDAYVLRSGGGGGFGSPLERDLASLARDVRCGYVSKHAAETLYGAVFALGSNDIDAAATAARRAEMRRQGLPQDEPIADTGVPPPAPSQPHAHDHAHEKLSEEERVALAMTGRCCS